MFLRVPRQLLRFVDTLGSRPFNITSAVGRRHIITPSESQEEIQNQQQRNQVAVPLTELVRDFLDPGEFYKSIRNSGISFFCGVPDSLLKDFCAYVTANSPAEDHVIAANEGNAVSIAIGYHLASHKPACVYLQNSGLGNIINPLMSLAVPAVYSVPMLILIGWRGEPGKRDEPQHITQGKVTAGMLDSCGIPYQILPDYFEGAEQALEEARKHMDEKNGPYAMLVRRQTFLPFKLPKSSPQYSMSREIAMKGLINCLSDDDIVVSTTGMLSRELFEHRAHCGQGHEKDFLTVGGMGHASSIALGIALQVKRRQVFCLDGDGAVLMHMGSLPIIGSTSPSNFKHVVLNNEAHDSVGGQPSAAASPHFSITSVAKASGYKEVMVVSEMDELKRAIDHLRQIPGPALVEVKVNQGSRKDLGRPTRSPLQNKLDFMRFIAS